MIDVARARADTPGCAEVVHLNNAGAALAPRPVLDAVREHLALETRVGGYAAADAAAERLDAVRSSVARLIGADADEVAFTENASRAWSTACAALATTWRPGDRILLSRSEYGANVVAALHAAARTGAIVEVVPDDENGRMSLEHLGAMLDDRVRLVGVGWIPTQGGRVNPVAEVGALTRAAGVPYLLDATQAVGQLAVDVAALDCDVLCGTGRKYLRGPRGTGFLYVRREWITRLDPPVLDLHGAAWVGADTIELRADARRFETWETSFANRLGLGAAAELALALGADAIEQRVVALGRLLRARLRECAGVDVLDFADPACGIVTFRTSGPTPAELATTLRADGINIGASTIDFARWDFEARGIDALARASAHYYNTEEELDRFVAAVDARAGA